MGWPGPDDARQPRAGLRDQLRRAVHHALGEHEGTALPQLHGTSARKRARADLGAASIQQDGARRAEVATHAFQQIHARPVFVVRAVREVETRHVHACGQQPRRAVSSSTAGPSVQTIFVRLAMLLLDRARSMGSIIP